MFAKRRNTPPFESDGSVEKTTTQSIIFMINNKTRTDPRTDI